MCPPDTAGLTHIETLRDHGNIHRHAQVQARQCFNSTRGQWTQVSIPNQEAIATSHPLAKKS